MHSSNIICPRPEGRTSGFAAARIALLAVVLAASGMPVRAAKSGPPRPVRSYSGACDASAVAPVNGSLFAAASDESSVLRLYRRGVGGAPVREVPLAPFLGRGARHEPDFEGAARLGERIYWIGSHARNDRGEARPDRHVLLATEVQGAGGDATLVAVGRPYRGLVTALESEPALAEFRFGTGARRSGEAPGGLNIEGLAAGPDGALWIGFRNPVPEGRAVVVPLLNPIEVTGPGAAKPRFGAPLRLALGGAGIRDFTRSGDAYLVIAGPPEGGGRHRLFAWKGGPDQPAEVVNAIPKGFPAEGVFVDPATAELVEIFADDGGEKIGGQRCEDIADPARRSFRALAIPLPAALPPASGMAR